MDRVKVGYGIFASPLGRLLVAATPAGVAAVSLGDSDAELVAALRESHPQAQPVRDFEPLAGQLHGWARQLQAYLGGSPTSFSIPLAIEATHFRRRVWRELQRIPLGSTRTYGVIAAALGQPTAARAVAGACAANPVSLIIPCHRVVASDGGLGGYRWGVERKARLLALEGATVQSDGTVAGAG